MIEYYINELLDEGITHIATWSELSQGGGSHDEVCVEERRSSAVKGSNAVAGTGLSVIVSPSSPIMSRTVSRTSTMHLGASAGNIACADEGILKTRVAC